MSHEDVTLYTLDLPWVDTTTPERAAEVAKTIAKHGLDDPDYLELFFRLYRELYRKTRNTTICTSESSWTVIHNGIFCHSQAGERLEPHDEYGRLACFHWELGWDEQVAKSLKCLHRWYAEDYGHKYPKTKTH